MGLWKSIIGYFDLQSERREEKNFDKPISAEDSEEISVLVKLRYRDDTTKEYEARVRRNNVPVLVEDLMNYDSVREAWVYEEISYHHKNYDETPVATIPLGAALGASMVGVVR